MKWHALGVAIAFGILIFFSCYKLTESPPLWYDEGIYTQVAENLAETGRQAIQVAPDTYVPTSYLTVGYPTFLPVSTSYHFFGVGVWQGRTVMVLYIVGLGLVAYALIRRLYGERIAALSLLLLATFPMLYGNGKTVIGEVPGLFFVLCSLYALVRLEKTEYRNWKWCGTLGIFAGLAVASKPIFILLPAALLLAYAIQLKKISLSLKGLAVVMIGGVIPLALWVFMQFGADASLQNILGMYVNPSAGSVQNFLFTNLHRFVSESTPLYLAFLLIIWGVALWVRRKIQTVSSAELTAFLFSILVVLAYLRIEGWYRYLFPALVVALPFFPAAVISLYRELENKIPSIKKLAFIPILFLVALSLGQFYQTAHTSFVAQYYDSTKTRDMERALADIAPKQRVFLYNAPDAAILLPSANYWQYLKLSAVRNLGEEELPFLKQGTADLVIVSAEDQQVHPELFEKYRQSSTVGSYQMLMKSQ